MSTTAGRWVAASASVRGASHERDGKPNQDAVRVVVGRGAHQGLVAAVCDGHGGDRYVRSDVGSRFGAEVACEVGLHLLEQLAAGATVANIEEQLSGPVAATIVQRWRDRVLDDVRRRPFDQLEANRARVPLDAEPLIAYGCTLLLAIFSDRWVGLLQVGDGDVTAVYDDHADSPVPTDSRLVGGETTSLCLPTAGADARVRVLVEPLPSVVVLTTDGYANSFASPNWRTDAGFDLRDNVRRLGVDNVEERMPAWLAESATAGGDDVSMALVARRDVLDVAPASAFTAIPRQAPSATTATPAPVRSKRLAVVGGIAAALAVGIAGGWVLNGGDTPTGTAAPSSSATTVLSTDTSVSPSVSTTVPGTPPSGTIAPPGTDSSPTTTEPAVLGPPVSLRPNDLAVIFDGPTVGVVLAFEPFNTTSNSPQLIVQTRGGRDPKLPQGWTFTNGALRFKNRCESAAAVAFPGFIVWALSTDGTTLTALDASSGNELKTFQIDLGIELEPPQRDPCAGSATTATPAPTTSIRTAVTVPASPSTLETTSTSTKDQNQDQEDG